MDRAPDNTITFTCLATLRWRALAVVLIFSGLVGGCAEPLRPGTTTVVNDGLMQEPTASPAVQAAEYQRILAELRRASECVSAVESKHGFAALQNKAPPSSRQEPYPKQFLDKSKATATESALIGSFLSAIGPCQPDFGHLAVRTHLSITRMISETWQQQQELYQHLKAGRITWGVFNQGTRSNADKLSGGLQALRLTNQG